MKNRRSALKKIGAGTLWVTPVVNSVVLPVHAQTSVACGGAPIVEVISPASCSAPPTVAESILGIRAFDANEQSLKAVNVTTSDANSDLTDFPFSLPFLLDQNVGALLTWNGPADTPGSGLCFPIAAISLELEYCCSDGISVFETYDITQLIIDANLNF